MIKYKINYWKLAVSIVICQLAGIIGSFFTVSSVNTWYIGLTKPSFNPPNWVFSPVWITLFFLMGISLYIVWDKGIKTKQSKKAVSIFGVQLVLNTLWSILFFGLKSPLYAFIEIIFLWAAILLSIIFFYRISRTASYLLIPYILWVSFAAFLNYFIVYLNI
ncbi:tryptophan-rich sensory protein [Candidatus Woesearchaeota archaeon]|nr:tryptophan-rich sensory protein [Candidatus Woesearchaeota archaeon]